MRPYAVLSLLPLLLAACETPEQLAAKQAAYQDSLSSQCRAYGFKYGTADYARCVMQVDRDNQARSAAATQALLDYSAKTLNPPPSQRRSIDCTSVRSGNVINTSCD